MNTTKTLNRFLASQKGLRTRKLNEELHALRSRLIRHGIALSPFIAMATKWDKNRKVKNFLRTLFKSYGVYDRGLFLLDITIQRQVSEFEARLFLTWQVTNTKLGIGIYETFQYDGRVSIFRRYEPKESEFDLRIFYSQLKNTTEKDVLQYIVKNYPMVHDTVQVFSNKAIDLTSETRSHKSGEEWKDAVLELHDDGYFDGIDNLYSVLRKAEVEMLADNQKVIVLGTDIVDVPKDDDGPGERVLVEHCVTVGYLREYFKQSTGVNFTLEEYESNSELNMVHAKIAMNRAPIIIRG